MVCLAAEKWLVSVRSDKDVSVTQPRSVQNRDTTAVAEVSGARSRRRWSS